MGADFSGITINISVTILMIVMVVFMPLVDRFICRKLGVSLTDGISTNPDADRILHIRKILLIFVFIVYLGAVAYVAFLSRQAADDYLIHINLYKNLTSAIHIDFGILGLINAIFTQGFSAALQHVQIYSLESINQVYLNIVMFVPMGYLLPYVFDWYRRHIRFRTVVTCFLASLLIENLQLITKLGFYDMDDIFSNTFGGFVGQWFYVVFAYVLTHPDFRQEFKKIRRWRTRAKDRAIYPFFSKIHVLRITLFATDQKEVFDFYGKKLGFRLKKLIPRGENDGDYLFDFGRNQIEIKCSDEYRDLLPQRITIACNNSEYLKKNLEKHGIQTSGYMADPYSGLRTFSFEGPDKTEITIIEE